MGAASSHPGNHLPSQIRMRDLGIEQEQDEDDVRESVTILTASLASAGCPTLVVESAASRALAAFDLRGITVSLLSTSLLFMGQKESWGVRFPRGLSVNLSERSLHPLKKCGDYPSHYNATYLAAWARQMSTEGFLYPLWLQFFAWVLMQAGCTIVFFEASWAAAGCCAVISILTFFFAAFVSAMWPRFSFLSGFLGGLTGGFATKVAIWYNLLHPGCSKAVLICSIMALVPGSGITFGTLDLIQGDRLFGLFPAFNKSIFRAFSQWIFSSHWSFGDCFLTRTRHLSRH
jgi:uncharacterized membrane protein YjjP (DUF1212 family)